MPLSPIFRKVYAEKGHNYYYMPLPPIARALCTKLQQI